MPRARCSLSRSLDGLQCRHLGPFLPAREMLEVSLLLETEPGGLAEAERWRR